MRRYYQILGISPNATQDEIKQAWIFSIKAFHPDKFSGSSKGHQVVADERTKAINEAYDVLSDPIKRAKYDRDYAQSAQTKTTAPPPPRPAAPPPPRSATRPAYTSPSGDRRPSKASRKSSFDFRSLLKAMIREIADELRTVVAFLTAILTLGGRLSKGTTIVCFALILAIALGVFLLPHQYAPWARLRGVRTKTAHLTPPYATASDFAKYAPKLREQALLEVEPQAAELYEKAADQGDPNAQTNLGWMYHEGQGVPRDYRRAVELFQKAADQGDATGQAYLASSYAEGKGVPEDYPKAVELFHKAVNQGQSPNAFNDFAWFLATCPDQSQRNGKDAVAYANKACQLTEWRDASFIDTLAAAFAELGDFNAAVKYQQQAIAIGGDYPDKPVMEKALKLYQERKPYRE